MALLLPARAAAARAAAVVAAAAAAAGGPRGRRRLWRRWRPEQQQQQQQQQQQPRPATFPALPRRRLPLLLLPLSLLVLAAPAAAQEGGKGHLRDPDPPSTAIIVLLTFGVLSVCCCWCVVVIWNRSSNKKVHSAAETLGRKKALKRKKARDADARKHDRGPEGGSKIRQKRKRVAGEVAGEAGLLALGAKEHGGVDHKKPKLIEEMYHLEGDASKRRKPGKGKKEKGRKAYHPGKDPPKTNSLVNKVYGKTGIGAKV